jgi:hypothetical protein
MQMCIKHCVNATNFLVSCVFTSPVAGGTVPIHRQVLPPVPGYIPVYIQHGDVPPDPNDFWIFQAASKNVRPRVSPAIYIPTTTTEVTELSGPLAGSSDTPSHNASNKDILALYDGKVDKPAYGISEESTVSGSSVNNILNS